MTIFHIIQFHILDICVEPYLKVEHFRSLWKIILFTTKWRNMTSLKCHFLKKNIATFSSETLLKDVRLMGWKVSRQYQPLFFRKYVRGRADLSACFSGAQNNAKPMGTAITWHILPRDPIALQACLSIVLSMSLPNVSTLASVSAISPENPRR